MILQPRCWVPYSTFVLVLLELVKWILWVPLLRALWLPFGCAVLCGLVLECGFAVVQRSSRSLRGFGASLPVVWSHPTFVRYKTSYPLFKQVILVLLIYCREDRATLVPIHIGNLSIGIKAFVVTVGLTIIHISTFSLSIVCYCLFITYSPLKKPQKILKPFDGTIILCFCVHQVASHPLYIYCVVFHLLSAPLLV